MNLCRGPRVYLSVYSLNVYIMCYSSSSPDVKMFMMASTNVGSSGKSSERRKSISEIVMSNWENWDLKKLTVVFVT